MELLYLTLNWLTSSGEKGLDLAKRKNAVIKVSGASTLSKKPYPFPDIWDPLARVFDAWGLDRCLWGTDWTRAHAVVNYEQAVEPFLKTDRLSDSDRARSNLSLVAEERLTWTGHALRPRMLFSTSGLTTLIGVPA